ncbi:methyltransferase family protein [Roseovarius halotolerans]|uniref:Tellurite methyltransferase n=1 Tax=Roseovarius halotolerans TaxID=505353 RepID=A0A1X6YJX3_9RHOB|nr:class I SAM-dependent methyltransferase [Roseovarius halotolerans]RKT34422.1 methyltransferase family protein [Roseovarius halotolerans]SLN23524.1 Tellurite methyltransferase [Roseovarius halotolerans]
MWEERFSTAEYVFGREPAAFLQDHADLLTPGATALSVADGEGRNSVFMAERGMRVTALEFSPSAIAKARALAADKGQSVTFHEVDVLAHDWPDQYDLVAGIFIQFVGPSERAGLFAGMKRSVAPGGLILLHGYTPKQVEYGTGGPPDPANMYTEDLLRDSFAGWEIVLCQAYERDIREGSGHAGRSALIDFAARRPIGA